MSKTSQRKQSAYDTGRQDAKKGLPMSPPQNISQPYIAGYKQQKSGVSK